VTDSPAVQKALRDIPPELRLAAGAALGLVVSMILPWYQKSVASGRTLVSGNLSAFGVFSFVEAAILIVALGVLFLVWARGQGRAFHLPGGDGFAITLAGGWAMALLVWRLFDKPNVDGNAATVGIQWGIFAAMLAAGALIAAGARVRALHRPEPPNPAEDPGWIQPETHPRPRPADRRPADATAVTEALRQRPEWEGDAPDPPTAPTRRLDEPGEEPGAPRPAGGEGPPAGHDPSGRTSDRQS
jgi:hypothetical protein